MGKEASVSIESDEIYARELCVQVRIVDEQTSAEEERRAIVRVEWGL